MGCDIHIVLERKYGLRWIAADTFAGHASNHRNGWASPIATDRNYERFAALAKVRGEVGLVPRGLPPDISETTAMIFDEWEGDAHSMSWLTLDEAAPIFLATERGEVNDYITKYPKSHFFGVDEERHPQKHRIVFWFDN
jgi:hypothetical protein